MRVLVTGGAGFIGSHVSEELARRGAAVMIVDNLDPQVHASGEWPVCVHSFEKVRGDVRDAALMTRLVSNADVVIHLAAAVGNAQSMYKPRYFAEVNNVGTASVLEAVLAHRTTVRRVVVASSMSLYGEGSIRCSSHGVVSPPPRTAEALAKSEFGVRCSCGELGEPTMTAEHASIRPATIYAVTKRDQEECVLLAGAAFGFSAVALRLFNTYGPRQSLSNPYTGVGAIIASRLLAGRQPVIFEDGEQTRDFVNVVDVARAIALTALSENPFSGTFNVGTGIATPLSVLGRLVAREIGVSWQPEISRTFRVGDIRHCTADIRALQTVIDWRPEVSVEQGAAQLVAWARTTSRDDRLDRAVDELKKHGLVSIERG